MSERDLGMPSGPTIEALILANHAEAINGLLYISGGGWTNHWRPAPQPGQPIANSHFGIALSILVPWTHTNTGHALSIKMEREDGGDPLVEVGGNIEAGRPAGVPPGSDQRVVLAINVDVGFARTGGHRIVAQLDSGDRRTTSFQVFDTPAQQGQP